MSFVNFSLSWILFSVLFLSCQSKTETSETPLGLKDYYKEYFTMGVAVNSSSFEDASAKLINQEFQSLTAENGMKMGPIHPKENAYNWDFADSLIAFARDNNMKVRGHALCWHRQAPDWFFVDENGNDVNKEVLLQRLRAHITAVVTRYKDDVYAWDVVNEVVSDEKDEYLRPSKFYQIAGPDFIAKAFEYARAADPDAILFYNDYSVVDSVKRKKIHRLISELKTAGVPIDGLGIQAHWSIYSPNRKTIEETIDAFDDLNLNLQITELDVSVYPSESGTRMKNATDIDDFTEEMEKLQVGKYDTIFQVFREKKDRLSAVTFWNVSDRHSWLDFFPVRGRKNYPLLFDQEYKSKKAYEKVISF